MNIGARGAQSLCYFFVWLSTTISPLWRIDLQHLNSYLSFFSISPVGFCFFLCKCLYFIIQIEWAFWKLKNQQTTKLCMLTLYLIMVCIWLLWVPIKNFFCLNRVYVIAASILPVLSGKIPFKAITELV